MYQQMGFYAQNVNLTQFVPTITNAKHTKGTKNMKTWIMTIPTSEMSKRELLHRLRLRSGRWQFGIEVGANSGYEHYQIRYECSNGDYAEERRYWTDIKCELQEAGGWSDYELKSGHYYQSLDDTMGKYRFTKLKELQLCILAHGRESGDRKITAVIDKRGGVGKTFLGRWLCLNGRGIYIDGSGRASDIVADIYDQTSDGNVGDKYFIIDLTRNSDTSRSELWSAIEQIKNGYLKDRRYSFKFRWIRPPRVFIYANSEPDWKKLSKDRWDKIFIGQLDDRHIKMWDKFTDCANNHIPRIRVFPS